METLELPTIDPTALDRAEKIAGAALPATQSVPAVAAPTDLAKLDLTAVALSHYGDWRGDVTAVKANLSTLVLDLTNATKVKEARALRQRLIGDPLATVRKVATALKSKMAQTSKAVGTELEKIEAAYAEADALILPQIEKREAELEAERERQRLEEEARKERHRTGIAAIRIYVERAQAPGMTAERIANGIAQLEAIPTPTKEQWEEFAVPAASAICETIEAMRKLLASAQAAEAQAAENERVRKENEQRALTIRQLAAITTHVSSCFGAKSDVIEARIRGMADLLPAGCAEQVTLAHAGALGQLDVLLASAKQQEATQRELEALRAAAPITQTPEEKGLSTGTPVVYASTEPKAATDSGNGDEGKAVHAEERTADPASIEQPKGLAGAARGPATAEETTHRGADTPTAAANDVVGAGDDAKRVVGPASPGGLTPATETPTLKLGAIGERLGFSLTRAFVETTLGKPARGTDKSAVLWFESDFKPICAALVAHIQKAST